METINYTPAKPTEKPAQYNKVIVTWKHGFQHTFASVGNALTGHLKALEAMEYVKEVIHYSITREEYDGFYGAKLEDLESTAEAPVKKSKGKNSIPAFSSLENFFDGDKGATRKSRRK
jgi:hypothetical protein